MKNAVGGGHCTSRVHQPLNILFSRGNYLRIKTFVGKDKDKNISEIVFASFYLLRLRGCPCIT